jgi:hypothetical protein
MIRDFLKITSKNFLDLALFLCYYDQYTIAHGCAVLSVSGLSVRRLVAQIGSKSERTGCRVNGKEQNTSSCRLQEHAYELFTAERSLRNA